MSGAGEGVALAACPFCGGTETGLYRPTEAREGSGWHDWFVRCHQCHVESAEYETEAEAVAAWNTRTTPPARSYADGVADVVNLCRQWSDPGAKVLSSMSGLTDAEHAIAQRTAEGIAEAASCLLSQGGKA